MFSRLTPYTPRSLGFSHLITFNVTADAAITYLAQTAHQTHAFTALTGTIFYFFGMKRAYQDRTWYMCEAPGPAGPGVELTTLGS